MLYNKDSNFTGVRAIQIFTVIDVNMFCGLQIKIDIKVFIFTPT